MTTPQGLFNCPFKFRCDKTWDTLKTTYDPTVKYCNDCEKDVHLVQSDQELKQAIKEDWCIAVVELDRQYSMRHMPVLTVGEIEPPKYIVSKKKS
jgi:hypothetical protein